MGASSKLPVTVLTGFLGSGKTTLLNRALSGAQWADTAVVVNELGEVALDHLLIESASDNIQVLASGCLCCTLQGGLRQTLADLFVRRVNGKVPHFARVIVETTGLADPGPVANSIVSDSLLRAEYRFLAIATTVDAMQGQSQLAQYAEAARQAMLADVLLLTKADLASVEQTASLRRALHELNPAAPIVESVRGDVNPQLLFPGDSTSRVPEIDAAPIHTHVHASSFVIEHPVHWSGLAAWMAHATEHFGERLLRVKGLFTMAEDGSAVAIHGIGRFFHPPERLGRKGDGVSRLVCIVRDIGDEELKASIALFEKEQGTRGI